MSKNKQKIAILFHGTSSASAKAILKEGVKIPNESPDWFFGRGAYFSLKKRDARYYAEQYDQGVVLKCVMPLDKDPCKITNIEGIGTFFQWATDHCPQNMTESAEEKCYKDYLFVATDEAKARIKQGCPIVKTNTQVVVHDDNIVKKVKCAIEYR